MKRVLATLIFFCSSLAYGQWFPSQNSWVRADGGDPAVAGSGGVTPYSGTPVLGDIIYFDGANWVSLPKGAHADGELLTLAAGLPAWAAGAGGGAPTNATYITQTANGSLSAEQALGALGTGLVKNTTTTGVLSIYAGASCTAQFPRSSDASGAWTCASVNLAADVTGDLPFANFVQSSAASKLVGRGSASGAGDFQEITIGTGLSMSGTTLSASSAPCDPTTQMCPTFDEYACGASSSATVVGSCKGVQNVNNTTSGTAGTKTGDGVWGVGFISTSTTTGGISDYTGTNASATHLLDTMYWQGRFQLNRLSTTADKFAVLVGSSDVNVSSTSTAATDGVWFSYTNDDGNASPNWKINVASDQGGAGGTTTQDSGVAVAATTWTTLRWSYEAGVGVHFYINGVETSNSPINATLPTASGREFGSYNYKILKTGGAGTLACELWFDYDVFGIVSITR